MKELLMCKIADKIIDVNLKMVAGEKLLIVTESEKLSIANAIAIVPGTYNRKILFCIVSFLLFFIVLSVIFLSFIFFIFLFIVLILMKLIPTHNSYIFICI